MSEIEKIEFLQYESEFLPMKIKVPKVNCPKHGIHEYNITSTIPNHEGVWCQLCWLESLGPSLEYVDDE